MQNADEIDKLIERLLKAILIIAEKTISDKKEPHDFEHRQPDVCVAYHRDRGEKYRQSKQDEEYIYTFDEGQAVWIVTTEEYVRNTPAIIHLGLGTQFFQKQALLLDEILRVKAVVDNPSYWQTDEFAESGKVTEACIAKAKEARLDIIERNRAYDEAMYEAYYR